MTEDAHPEYWGDYTNLQYVKHKLIREYLNGWFPKLGLWSERINYFDTHAGRGKYRTGEAGSPVVAIDTLLRHNSGTGFSIRAKFIFSLSKMMTKTLKHCVGKSPRLGYYPNRFMFISAVMTASLN
jgi:three-Cys-motif partner protein